MSDAIPFAWTDAWLLHAILLAAENGQARLDEVIAAADMIQHAMLTFDEIDGGIARLSRAGLISIGDKQFHLTATATEIQARMVRLSVRKADEACRTALGLAPPEPPFRPTPADPAWTSHAFTIEEVRKAEKDYRRRVWGRER